MKKRIKKYFLGFLILFLLFLVIGAAAPFAKLKTAGREFQESLDVKDFYGDSVSVDRAMLMETNRSALEERIRLMNQAQERIILSTFDMRQGESTKDILAVLLEAAERGVSAQVLVDGFSAFVRMEGKSLFYALSSHPNVEIRVYNRMNFLEPWKTQGRMHDKYVIADDIGYILGGRNTFDYFIGEYETKNQSYDREVLVFNTAAGTEHTAESSLGQIRHYFEEVWNGEACTVFHDSERLREKRRVKEQLEMLKKRYEYLKEEYSECFREPEFEKRTVMVEKITLLSNPTGIYGKEPRVWYALSQLMEQAEQRVWIHTPYAVFSGDMYEGMRKICSRGKEVFMVINSVENGDNLFASSDYLRNKGDILKTGIELYEYDGGISYHGKSVLIDDTICVIGSYNFDLRSTYLDTELMLVIDSRKLNASLAGYMEAIQKDCKKPVSETEYEIPEHITVAPVPFYKRILWKIIGIVMQPFRFLI